VADLTSGKLTEKERFGCMLGIQDLLKEELILSEGK